MQSNLHLTSGFGPLVLMFSKSWSFVLLTSLIRFWIVWETWNEVCMMKCWFLYLKWRNVEMLLSSVWRTICFSTSSLLNPFKSLLVCGFACRWVTAHPCRHGDDSNTTLPGHSSLFPSRASGSPFSSTHPPTSSCFPQRSWRHTWACLDASRSSTRHTSRTGEAASCELRAGHRVRLNQSLSSMQQSWQWTNR